MSEKTDASGAQVPRIFLLTELSGELDKWLSGAKDIPDTVHNRAVRNAVSVVADAVAVTRARLEAQQSDAERTTNATDQARAGSSSPESGCSAFNPDFAWYCPTCERSVQNEHVTFQETHDLRCGGCGNPVQPLEAP